MMNKTEPTFDECLLLLHDRLLNFSLGLTRNMEDAKDLIQESMLKALMNRDQYTAGTNIKAWMFTIVRNTFINSVKRDRRGQMVMESAARQDLPVANGGYRQSPIGSYSTKEMENSVERLPDAIRTPFTMNFKGYKYHEIANTMGIPIGTVKSRIYQARKQLMVELDPGRAIGFVARGNSSNVARVSSRRVSKSHSNLPATTISHVGRKVSEERAKKTISFHSNLSSAIFA